MRSLLLLLGSLVFGVGVFIAGMAFTAYLIAEPDSHRFANLETPDLWTSKPVEVDTAIQDYERIGAAVSIASIPASRPEGGNGLKVSGSSPALGLPAYGGGSEGDAGSRFSAVAEIAAPALDPAHVEWCFGRYRSYSLEDDSYQPYGGGERQRCESPWTPSPVAANENPDAGSVAMEPVGEAYDRVGAPNGQSRSQFAVDDQSSQVDTAGMAPVGAHEEWCFARYRSYSADSNTYQPFDGGPRKACSSPYG